MAVLSVSMEGIASEIILARVKRGAFLAELLRASHLPPEVAVSAHMLCLVSQIRTGIS